MGLKRNDTYSGCLIFTLFLLNTPSTFDALEEQVESAVNNRATENRAWPKEAEILHNHLHQEAMTTLMMMLMMLIGCIRTTKIK